MNHVYVTLWQYRKLKSNKTIIHVNLCVALLVANVVLLGGLDKTSDKVSYDVIAIYSTHDVHDDCVIIHSARTI